MNCKQCQVAHAPHELINELCLKCTAIALVKAQDEAAHLRQKLAESKTQTLETRDWFAGMALMGICVNGEPEDVLHNSIVAYRNADAMINQKTFKA